MAPASLRWALLFLNTTQQERQYRGKFQTNRQQLAHMCGLTSQKAHSRCSLANEQEGNVLYAGVATGLRHTGTMSGLLQDLPRCLDRIKTGILDRPKTKKCCPYRILAQGRAPAMLSSALCWDRDKSATKCALDLVRKMLGSSQRRLKRCSGKVQPAGHRGTN